MQYYADAADRYGIQQMYSMTQLDELDGVRRVLGDRIRFIAVPDWRTPESRQRTLGRGFVRHIERFHDQGARIVKFWAAPQARDMATTLGDPDMLRLDSPARIEAMEAASALGMIFMTHVADPDTWFASRYLDTSTYGTKAQQYEPLEALLDRFGQPWIAAHMGGWPEDLAFLTGLLQRHDNLYLDSSATKWMVRELSRTNRDDLCAFLTRFQGRVLFGSDIVANEGHLNATAQEGYASKAGGPEEAFDLYAGRYWALRTLFETAYEGQSPIADPDLALVEPDRFTEMDAPPLSGKALPDSVLRNLYHDAAHALLDPICR